ncbi:hypothetical protein SSS_10352 [Sarcoptes scabiei]|nr:hypothetical protein SSS_10352 [Sarcoptes scabiei]
MIFFNENKITLMILTRQKIIHNIIDFPPPMMLGLSNFCLSKMTITIWIIDICTIHFDCPMKLKKNELFLKDHKDSKDCTRCDQRFEDNRYLKLPETCATIFEWRMGKIFGLSANIIEIGR